MIKISHCDLNISSAAVFDIIKTAARSVGIVFEQMENWTDDKPIPWAIFDDEPLMPLLSVCTSEGKLSPEDCDQLSRRLLEIRDVYARCAVAILAPRLVENALDNVDEFVAGLQRAAERGEELTFWG